jgi:hypothetical protein
MSQYALRLPDSLLEMARKSAKREHASMNQLFVSAIAEKLSALETENMLRERASLADKDAAHDVLARVQHGSIPVGDEV